MVLECPICLTGFDHRIYIPKVLPCGHTLCQTCVPLFHKSGQCPICKVPFGSPHDLPTNFIVIGEEARRMSEDIPREEEKVDQFNDNPVQETEQTLENLLVLKDALMQAFESMIEKVVERKI